MTKHKAVAFCVGWVPLFGISIRPFDNIGIQILLRWFPQEWRLASQEVFRQASFSEKVLAKSVSLTKMDDVG